MSKKQFFFGIIVASLLGGLIAAGSMQLFQSDQEIPQSNLENNNVKFTRYMADTNYLVPEGLNFVHAANMSRPAVVHIKSTMKSSANGYAYQGSPFDDMLREFFGEDPRRSPQQPRQRQSKASGSGVIINQEGFVVTNYHVIENAAEVEVTLNDNRTFDAEIVGTDPTTDLALLKIEGDDQFSYLKFGNSDAVQIGEWVLAVGNPFELTSTVTAGIVSAKGRNINILRNRQYGIEAFIQTDAAVNPGNSGGALVNLKGELIGINTAIATPTGTYAGYSFAVPTSLVEKVIADLKEYGVVQRALLGVGIRNVDANLADEKNLEIISGVYIDNVNENSAADEAGIQEGDVIVEVEGRAVKNVAQLQENIAIHRPGDKVSIIYIRDGKRKRTTATLKNMMGETGVVKKMASTYKVNGASFSNLTEDQMENYDVDGGVIINDIESGKWRDAGIREGFVITKIDRIEINDIDDLVKVLQKQQGQGILIEGFYEPGDITYYGVGL